MPVSTLELSLAVVERNQFSGIFTQQDVLMRVAGQPAEPRTTAVDWCMTRNPVTLRADTSVSCALNLMVIQGFRHIPIVDDAGRLVSLVSMRNRMEYPSEFFSRAVINLPPNPHARYHTREGT